jgi:hypothetical protein
VNNNKFNNENSSFIEEDELKIKKFSLKSFKNKILNNLEVLE